MQGLVGSIIDCIMNFLVSLIHLVGSLLLGLVYLVYLLIHLVLGCSLGILSGLVGCILGRISYRSDKGEQGEPVGPEVPYSGQTNLSPVCLISSRAYFSGYPGRTGRAPSPSFVRSNVPSLVVGLMIISLYFTTR